MENNFGIYVIFGRWNQRKRGPTAPKIQQGASGGAKRAQEYSAPTQVRFLRFAVRHTPPD